MAGHSKWKTIKQKKGAVDQRRSRVFSKLLQAITAAARENPDPVYNPHLRTVVEKARKERIPHDHIERAIRRASESK